MVFNKVSTAIQEPSKVRPYLRDRYRMAVNRNCITDWYENDNEPKYDALIIHPVYKALLPESEYSNRAHEWMRSVGIVRIFNDLGFNVDMFPYKHPPRRSILNGVLTKEMKDISEYDVVFGKGKKFISLAQSSDENTIFIQWADFPGSDPQKTFLSRIDNLERRKKVWYKDHRWQPLKRPPSDVFADGFLLPGDSRNKKKFKKAFPEKPAKLVPMSHPPTEKFNINNKNFNKAKNKFVVYAGDGPVFKGVDIALEAFSDIEDLELYVAGAQNKQRYNQFNQIYYKELNETSNIHNYGWVEMMSNNYYELCNNCGYLLYPTSADSGGPPGAVISMMWNGIVPIISEEGWADVGEYGIRLDDCRIKTVKETVKIASQTSSEELRQLSEQVYSYTRNTHSRENVYTSIENQLDNLLREIGFYNENN